MDRGVFYYVMKGDQNYQDKSSVTDIRQLSEEKTQMHNYKINKKDYLYVTND